MLGLSFTQRLRRALERRPAVTPGDRTVPGRFYGDGGTIHGTRELDVETRNGEVVAVWFRCSMVPFKQHEVDDARARDMRVANADYPPQPLAGLVFQEEESQ